MCDFNFASWVNVALPLIKSFIKDFIIPSLILVFTFLQWHIAKRKRKDDLFNVRYSFYKEVRKFILDLMSHASDCKNGRVSGLFCDRNPRKICEHYIEKESFSYSVKKTKQDFIEEVELLFGDDIAKHLELYITIDNINYFLKDYNGQHYWSTYSEFTKPFKKYLKID